MPFSLPFFAYHVSSPQDQTVRVALHPTIEGDVLSWFDGAKERIISIAKTDAKPEGCLLFTRLDKEDASYLFQPMTPLIYEQDIRPYMRDAPVCKTQAEVRSVCETWYRSWL